MTTNNTGKTYYTLFVFDKETKEWHDEFGSYSRSEVLDEADCFFGERKRIMKNDGTLEGLMRNYVELGQPLRGLKPSNGALVLDSKRYPHADDAHLHTVLCQWNDEFVVWTFNEQDGGCYYGNYCESREAAYTRFWDRTQRVDGVINELRGW